MNEKPKLREKGEIRKDAYETLDLDSRREVDQRFMRVLKTLFIEYGNVCVQDWRKEQHRKHNEI